MGGSRVRVHDDKKKVIEAFTKWRTGKTLKYERGMDAMLGADFTVKSVGFNGTFGLVAQEGGDIWEFPEEALHLKLGISLPIDPFLDSGAKPLKALAKLKDRKDRVASQQRPLCAYDRPIAAAGTDICVSKNRMGYFICF